jgi:molybdopterin-containing oxidoreductase family iron-sulfur binding subunit
MDRRTFLKWGGLLAAVSAATPASQLVLGKAMGSSGTESKVQWAMTVDANKCDQCVKLGNGQYPCEQACRDENNVPLYGDERYDIYWIRVAEAKPIELTGAEDRKIPLICVMCEDPPCVHVCPTKASFRREEDGIVLIDEHRCIGCRYCVVACPYRARTVVFKEIPDSQWHNREIPKMMLGVATKCTFCQHRDLAAGELPACVEKCPFDALTFGNRESASSQVSKIIAEERVQVLRPNLETKPNVFYLGV